MAELRLKQHLKVIQMNRKLSQRLFIKPTQTLQFAEVLTFRMIFFMKVMVDPFKLVVF